MSIKITMRHDTSSGWTTANPTLSDGEPGYETNTAKYKLGDGVTAWTGLAYSNGLVGAISSHVLFSYGDGSDGNVTLSSGTTNLARDMYYNNLTISGTGILITSGYRIFVLGTLTLSNAPSGAISSNGAAGGVNSGATGGVAPASFSANSIGNNGAPSAGGTSTTGVGGQAPVPTNPPVANGGAGGAGGTGGAGSNAGGASRPGATITFALPHRRVEPHLLYGATLIQGGAGGAGGGGGGGSGLTTGIGGGSGGSGGGIVAIFANTIARGASTAANCIQANGGAGAAGGNGLISLIGAGAGGGGGGGGWVYICYGSLTGTAKTNAIQTAGGTGGVGGNGFLLGQGANGGSGGSGGRVTMQNVTTGVGSESFGSAGTAGGTFSGTTGGTGGAGNSLQVNL